MAAELAALSISLPFDQRLAAVDVAGSHAHVDGLVAGGILDAEEGEALHAALDQALTEIHAETFVFVAEDEDIHTALERRVTEIAGDSGAKLHTGRSRNDQIATDLRLWTKAALAGVAADVLALQSVLVERAADAGSIYLPGYTHLQRAQPVLLAHHLAAHVWALTRDVDRILATIERADVSPLGAGALAGSSLPLDPDSSARAMGFARRFENSLDAVSDRDFVAEALFDIALLGVHLSRMGEEIVLWSTDEFSFCILDDAFATGSSMLPQKKNADVAELARGKSGRFIGNLTALLVTLKGLPLAYNRDLQEDKEPLFDSVDQVTLVLRALAGMYATVRWNDAAMRSAADAPGAAAVDLAEFLVRSGVPFRRAHAIVGGLVAASIADGVPLIDLVAAHPQLGEDAASLLTPGTPVTMKTTPGGAGPEAVAQQIRRLVGVLDGDRQRLAKITS
jgi:argininosuccinate lyase